MTKRERSDGAGRRRRTPSPDRTAKRERSDGARRRRRTPSPDRTAKRHHSDGASRRPRRPSPERNDGQPPASTKEITPTELLVLVRNVKEYFKDVDPDKITAFLNLMKDGKEEKVSRPCVISQVKTLFRGHKEMLILFNKILYPEFKILFKEDVPEIRDLAELYVAKIKMRSSPSVFTTFKDILYLYKEHVLTSNQVDREVEVLFAKACDLLEEYDFLRPGRAAPVVQSPVHPRHSVLEVSELRRKQQRERLRRMCEDVAKRKRKEKGKGVVTELKQSPPKRVSFRLADAADAPENRRSSRLSSKEHPRRPARTTPAAAETQGRNRSRSRVLASSKSIGRAVCTPSYLLVKPPRNGDGDGEGKAKVSVHRSELAKSVLNEECKLVRGRGSKDRILNPYEEKLFKCEKNQYKWDTMIKMLEASAKSFMNYLLKLQVSRNGQLPPMEELLSWTHRKCIKKLYGCDGEAFIEALKENPARALLVLINRLVLKLEELKRLKTNATPLWSQVYKNNFHLSLNYTPK